MAAALKQLAMGQVQSEEWRKYEMKDVGVRSVVIPYYSDIVSAMDVISPSGHSIVSVEVYCGGVLILETVCDKSVEYAGMVTSRVPFGEYPCMNMPYTQLEVRVWFNNSVMGKVYMNVCHVFIKDRGFSKSGLFRMRSDRRMDSDQTMNERNYAEVCLLGFRIQDNIPESVRVVDTKCKWDVLSYDALFISSHNNAGELLLRTPMKVTPDYILVTTSPIVCVFERTIGYETDELTHTTKLF
jgi:hypothetical protein